MRDHHDGLGTAEVVDRVHHRPLGQVVERARRLVEDQHVGIVVERAGDADALALPAREPDPALADLGGVAVGKLAHDEVVQLGDPRRPLHRRLVDIGGRAPEGDVRRDRVVGKEDLLRHVADRALPGAHVLLR